MLAYDPYLAPERATELGVRLIDDLGEMLSMVDFLSLHCPRTEETYHIMDWEQFAQVKPGLVLVNTARGPLINEDALVAAIKDGRIWAAGLDVTEQEPLSPDSELLTAEQRDPDAPYRRQFAPSTDRPLSSDL